MSERDATSILIVEDEPAQVALLTYNLEAEGFRLIHTSDGDEALTLAIEEAPDLIILDWMLPNLSGLEICRQLRRNEDTCAVPIIMLTARGEEADRIRGLETGADDYVTKPYSVNELVARVRALLRRSHPASRGATISYAGIVLDAAQHKVTRNGQSLELGPIEFRLLKALIERPGRVWSRNQLLDKVWSRDSDIDQRTVDVHIGRLRKTLNSAGGHDIIRTVRGTGYSLDGDV